MVENHTRIGIVPIQDEADGLDHRRRKGFKARRRRRGETRPEAGGGKQRTLITRGNVEHRGEPQDHPFRRARPAGFQKGQMARRNAGLACQLQLAHAAVAAPFPQMVAEFHAFLQTGAQ